MNENIRLLTEAIYNKLSEERAKAIYMWKTSGENSYYESEWNRCRESMEEMERNVAKENYKFVSENPWKRVGEFQYIAVYKLVAIT